MKVSFVGIGPGKSGSTWLYLALKSHPWICASNVKETNYFNDNYDRGIKWYHNLFDDCDGRIAGEISNTYIFSPEVAERIYEYNPDMKIISILRDPVERAVSHYFFLIRNGEKFDGFHDAVNRYPDLLDRGLYYKHLRPFLDRFERENIFIRIFDELKDDSEKFASDVFDFLGVSPMRIDKNEGNMLRASVPHNRYVALIVKKAAYLTRYCGFPVVVEKVKRSGLAKRLYKKIDYNVHEVLSDSRKEMIDYYTDDLALCSELVGVDLVAKWLHRYS